MKERGILFSAPMVRAILAGTKTQTRRIVRQMLCAGHGGPGRAALRAFKDGVATFGDSIPDDPVPVRVKCPFGVAGDRLWVRETFANLRRPGDEPELIYRADTGSWDETNDAPHEFESDGGKWKPSIHMPRRASRITLEVASARVERLQEITEEDAAAEGFSGWRRGHGGYYYAKCQTAREQFAEKWDELNGKRASWNLNPWVWVIGFKRIETREVAG